MGSGGTVMFFFSVEQLSVCEYLPEGVTQHQGASFTSAALETEDGGLCV